MKLFFATLVISLNLFAQQVSVSCKVDQTAQEVKGTLYADVAHFSFPQPYNDGSIRTRTEEQLTSLDYRCGTTLSPMAQNYNFEITFPGAWAEDVLQIPMSEVAQLVAGVKKTISTNVHTCMFDGDWSSASDVGATCELELLK